MKFLFLSSGACSAIGTFLNLSSAFFITRPSSSFEEVSARFDNIADFLDYIYSDEYRKEYDDYFERSELNE